jgi:ATP-binding cassette, subfamily B, multidrug efflux pump
MKELLSLNVYFIKYAWQMIFGIVFVLLSNIAGVFIPILVRQGLNEALFQSLIPHVIVNIGLGHPAVMASLGFGVLILLASALKGVFMYLMRKFIVVVSRHVEFDLKNDIYSHYQKLDLAFYRRNFTGDMMARIGEDVANVRMYVGPAVMYFANIVFVFVTVIFQMFRVNPTMSLFVLLPLPVLSFSIYKVSKIINKRTTDIQTQLSVLTTFAQETFAGIRVIKSFGSEANFTNAFGTEGREYRSRTMKLAFVNSLFIPLMMLLIGLSNLIVLYLGGLEVAKGTFTTGNIAEFVLYLNMLIWPVASLGWTTALVQKAAASQKRINEFLNTEPEQNKGGALPFKVDKSIEFKDVSFAYSGAKAPVLNTINFELKKGEILGITGRTGSGKSTIVQLLMRLYEPDGGEILVDNQALTNFNIPSFRHAVAYVPQDVFLFSDTIRENIAFGKETGDATDMEIMAVVKSAGLLPDIATFPDGLNTILGERGVTLSGGQKQRVSIARALLRNAELYIFDDCLSAVDANTEMEIIKGLVEELKDKTAVIVSHRVVPLSVADHIIVMASGNIVETGSREELLKLGGDFARLYLKQSQGTSVEQVS